MIENKKKETLLSSFVGEATTDFVSFTNEDAIFFKCRKIPNTFSMELYNAFLKSTNQVILFSAFEYHQENSIIAIGLKPTSYFQEFLIDNVVFLTRQRISVEVCHSKLPANKLISSLKEMAQYQPKPVEETADESKDSDTSNLFDLIDLKRTSKNITDDDFDQTFSYKKYDVNFGWELKIYENRISPSPVEKELKMFDNVKLMEEYTPYRLYYFQKQKKDLNLPNISLKKMEEFNEHKSFFED